MSGSWRIIKNIICLCFFALCFVIFLLLSLSIDAINREKKNEVPELKISLNNVTLEEINNGPKAVAYGSNTAEFFDKGSVRFISDLEIRGRGNASWSMDKRSYRIKVLGGINLLGLGAQKKLGLISNNIDDSLMRNDLGQYIAGGIYENYPIRGEFVNVKIDDNDLGLYYMVVLIDADKHSLGLKDNMGVIAELDNAYCFDGSTYRMTKEFKDCIQLEDAVSKDNEDVAFSNFVKDYNDFETALRKRDYRAISEKIDVESWAKYFVLSEFSSNPDAYVTSWYFYKDGETDKIKASLGWDFDAAFGNWNWGYGDEYFYSPYGAMTRLGYTIKDLQETDSMEKKCNMVENSEGHLISPSMCYLIAMPEFQEIVSQTYRDTLMGRRAEINEYIKKTAAYIRDDAIADNEMWSKGNFDDEIEYLLWWVNSRFDYFDEKYGGVGN